MPELNTSASGDSFVASVAETFADIQKRNAGAPVLVVFADGTFVILGEGDALIMAGSDPDYVTHIPVPALSAAINQAYN